MWQPSNAALWNPPDLCGVLEKQGRKNGEWKPRYFILKGSNLFWFSTPTARTPKGVVPLEGAAIHMMRGPMISESQGPTGTDQGGIPSIMFGIVALLDQTYAATPGGRTELAIGASSPELQALWAKALQAASISRPQLLAKLHQKSNPAVASSAPKSSRHPSHTIASAATTMVSSHRHPSHSSPEQAQREQQQTWQEHQESKSEVGLHARSLSDTGGLSTYSGAPPPRPRESFAFPTTGASGSSRALCEGSSVPAREACLSQFNVQQLQRQLEASDRVSAPSMATTAVPEGHREHSSHGRVARGPSRSPYRARSTTPPRTRTVEPAYSTLSGPAGTYPPAASPPSPAYSPIPGGGKDQGRYPLRQMMRNLTGKVVGRITPERRREGGGMYDGHGQAVSPGAVGGWGAPGHRRAVSPAAAAGTVGGRLVHGIMGNWAEEDEAPRGRSARHHHHHDHRRTPPASPPRSARTGRSPSPSPSRACSPFSHPEYNHGSEHHGSTRCTDVGCGRGAQGGSIPAYSPANCVTGLPLRQSPSPRSQPRSTVAPTEAHSQPGTPPHPLVYPQSGTGTPARAPASTCEPPDDLDQLSRQLRSAFMGLSSRGGDSSSCARRSSRGSDAGNSCVSAAHELAAQDIQQNGTGAAPGPWPQDELAAVQQQVSVAAQLLRAQADRLQNALSTSALAMAGGCEPSQQSLKAGNAASPEITPACAGSATQHPWDGSPASLRNAAPSQRSLPAETEAAGSVASSGGMRRRADTLFFVNQFQALQASLAEVAAAAAGAQQQQQQQQPPSSDPRGSMAPPRASMLALQEPLQHYLRSVQQQLARLQAHRASVEQDEAASLGSAMDAVQQALGALHGWGGGVGGSAGPGPPSPKSSGRGPSCVGSSCGDAATLPRTGSAHAHGSPGSPIARSPAPSRLGSSSTHAPLAGADAPGSSVPSRTTSSTAAGGSIPPPGMEGSGARASSIRQAASDLRSQIFQPSPELCALNQAQQQQVYASLQQQQQHSRPGSTISMPSHVSDGGLASQPTMSIASNPAAAAAAAVYIRPASAASMASNPVSAQAPHEPSTASMPPNTATGYSRQPSTASMPPNTATGYSRQPSTASMPPNTATGYSRQPSTASMPPNTATGYSRQPSTASMPPNLATGYSRQPSTASMPPNTATGNSRQPSTASMASGPAVCQSRQPISAGMPPSPVNGSGRQPSTASMAGEPAAGQSRQPSTMSMTHSPSNTSCQPSVAEHPGSMLPLPRLPHQALPSAPHLATARASEAAPAAGLPASSPSISSMQPTVKWAPPSPRASGNSHPTVQLLQQPHATSPSPRTESSPVGPPLLQRPSGSPYPRTASMPFPNQRVQQLQQQPRARYSSTDWC